MYENFEFMVRHEMIYENLECGSGRLFCVQFYVTVMLHSRPTGSKD